MASSWSPATAAAGAPEGREVTGVSRASVCAGCSGLSQCRSGRRLLAIGPRAVTTEAAHWRPIGHGGRRRGLIKLREFSGTVDDLAADDGEVRGDVRDLGLRAGGVVAVGNEEIGQLTDLNATFLALFVGEPGDVLGPHPERGLAVEAIALRVESQAADGLSRDEPGE